ncbi:MAG TPA: sulfite exporter TauE/SafE family protein [Planctomycetota bacterium]|nr:sulfite exporter TauE/SafE family protein [Planctomycetota bacterium]
MDMTAALIIGLLLGLVNGAHCAGMCGAFAIRAAVGPSRGGSVLRFVLYALGKVFTYVFLGALVGAVGQRLFLSARPFQAVMGVVVAALLVVAGLRLLGFLLRPGASGAFLAGKLAPYIRAATEKGPFVMGAVTGALPCGVVYLALAQAAASGTTILSTAVMVGLGIGTVPSLALLAFGSQTVVHLMGAHRVRLASGCLLILVGIFTAWRAIAPLLLEARDGVPPCCH